MPASCLSSRRRALKRDATASRPVLGGARSAAVDAQQAAELRTGVGRVTDDGARLRVCAREGGECGVLLDVIYHGGATDAQRRPHTVQLEADVAPRVQAVVDEQVDVHV